MQIICFNCGNLWEVAEGHLLGARLKFGLGFREYAFICPRCETKNAVTEKEFESMDRLQSPVPVTGTPPQAEKDEEAMTGPRLTGKAPTNPVEGPGPGTRQRQGIVLVRGLEARRDHNTWAETMGSVNEGDRVTILSTWSDGDTTWGQLGPERWVTIDHNGEALIKLIDE